MFAGGAVVYVDFRNSPKDTLDIYVIGKQWMWKAQQPNGLKEINELHVPVGRNIKPDHGQRRRDSRIFRSRTFRVKMDVMPGHYNTMWFRPTKPGSYHFFCSQYCGTNHAAHGWMGDRHERRGLRRRGFPVLPARSINPVVAGEKVVREKACNTCHVPDGKGRAPSLNGLYEGRVLLADGSTSPRTMPTSANRFLPQPRKSSPDISR